MIQSDPDTKTNASMILSWSQLVPVQHRLRLQHRLQQVADNLGGLRRGRQYNPGGAQRGELGRAGAELTEKAEPTAYWSILSSAAAASTSTCLAAQWHKHTATRVGRKKQSDVRGGGGEEGGFLYGCSQTHRVHRVLEASWKMNREFGEVLCVLVKSTVVN